MSSFDVDTALFLNAEERTPYITSRYTNRYQKEHPSIFLEIAARTNITKSSSLTNKSVHQQNISENYNSSKKLCRYVLFMICGFNIDTSNNAADSLLMRY